MMLHISTDAEDSKLEKNGKTMIKKVTVKEQVRSGALVRCTIADIL